MCLPRRSIACTLDNIGCLFHLAEAHINKPVWISEALHKRQHWHTKTCSLIQCIFQILLHFLFSSQLTLAWTFLLVFHTEIIFLDKAMGSVCVWAFAFAPVCPHPWVCIREGLAAGRVVVGEGERPPDGQLWQRGQLWSKAQRELGGGRGEQQAIQERGKVNRSWRIVDLGRWCP